jgi:hypothetical protein
MSTERKEILGDLTIATGSGTPTHAAPAGSLYVDIDTATLYARKQVDAGTQAWVASTATGGLVTATAVATDGLITGAMEAGAGSAVKLFLPTVDPGVADQLWADGGVVKVSAGA